MKAAILAVSAALTVLFSMPVSADEPAILMVFAAKGTWVGFDHGAVKVAYEKIAAVRENRVVISGSSSGSLLAVLHSCYGFSPAAMKQAQDLVTHFDKSKIAGGNEGKTVPFLLGHKIGNPHSNLDSTLEELLPGPCTANLPVLITAGNLEVNDDRTGHPVPLIPKGTTSPFSGAGNKVLDPSNLAVYRKGQAGQSAGYLGRACTYFANQPLYNKLLSVPEKERLCDLRLIQTQEDLKLALRASVAEPTYFMPWPDPNPSAVRLTEHPEVKVKYRTYNGGYGMTNPIQDIKRVYPDIFTLSTGRALFSGKTNYVIRNWFLVDLNQQIARQRWFVDAEIPYNEKEWNGGGFSETGPAETDSRIGEDRATACFDGKWICLPGKLTRPSQTTAAGTGQPLDKKVGRGLGYLLRGENGIPLIDEQGKPRKEKYETAAKACGAKSSSVAYSTQLNAVSPSRLRQIFGGQGCVWTSRSTGKNSRAAFELAPSVLGERKPTDSCYSLCVR